MEWVCVLSPSAPLPYLVVSGRGGGGFYLLLFFLLCGVVCYQVLLTFRSANISSPHLHEEFSVRFFQRGFARQPCYGPEAPVSPKS